MEGNNSADWNIETKVHSVRSYSVMMMSNLPIKEQIWTKTNTTYSCGNSKRRFIPRFIVNKVFVGEKYRKYMSFMLKFIFHFFPYPDKLPISFSAPFVFTEEPKNFTNKKFNL